MAVVTYMFPMAWYKKCFMRGSFTLCHPLVLINMQKLPGKGRNQMAIDLETGGTADPRLAGKLRKASAQLRQLPGQRQAGAAGLHPRLVYGGVVGDKHCALAYRCTKPCLSMRYLPPIIDNNPNH